jgi:hypothetical protein
MSVIHDGGAGGHAGDPGSRKRLTPGAVDNYAGDGLFDRLARVVCRANCLPRKELYEAWEVARRTRRRLRGGRVIDMACGHGLLGYAMLLIDDTSPSALCVDSRRPQSAAILAAAIEAEWPRLAGRVSYVEGDLNDVAVFSDDVVVSAHACGGLTDVILDKAIAAGAGVVVLPCCQQHDPHHPLVPWLSADLAIDVDRAARLRMAGYQVRAQSIPASITPKNRLLIGQPPKSAPPTS